MGGGGCHQVLRHRLDFGRWLVLNAANHVAKGGYISLYTEPSASHCHPPTPTAYQPGSIRAPTMIFYFSPIKFSTIALKLCINLQYRKKISCLSIIITFFFSGNVFSSVLYSKFCSWSEQ